MGLLNLLLVITWLSWAVWVWKTLPNRIALAHESFRTEGDSDVFEKDVISGQLMRTNIRLKASDCVFAEKATFYLIFPCIRSTAVAGDLKVEAITRWPTMKSYFVLQ